MHAVEKRRVGAILFVIALSSFSATFNETILNVALSPMMETFSINSGTVQWVVTLYMLVVALMIPIAGFLYRNIPTRRLLAGALVMMLVGSVLGAFAFSYPLLLLARILQAIGTGVMIPVTMNLTLVIAPKNKLGTYMGIVSIMTTLGPSCGPIAAGTALAFTSNWHVLFILFGVVVAVCLVCTLRFVPNAVKLDKPHLDALSTVSACLALIGIMYAISSAFNGTPLISAVSLAVGAIALIVFVRRQMTVSTPLIDFRPFRNGGFSSGMILMALAFMAAFTINIIIPLFMQTALGASAFAAALCLFPATICSAVVSPLAGRFYDKHGMRFLVPLAFLLMLAGSVALSRTAVDINFVVLTLIFIPVIIGAGMGVGPSQSFALSRLDPEIRNHGVTIVAIALQVAGCIGSSVFVGIMDAYSVGRAAAGVAPAVAVTDGFDIACLAICVFIFAGFILAVIAGNREARGNKAYVAARSLRHEEEAGVLILDELMHSDTWTIPVTATAYDALKVMADNGTSGLPVVNPQGRVVGFIVDGDIIRYMTGGNPESIGISHMYAWWQDGEKLEENLQSLKAIDAMELANKKVISVEREAGIEDLCRKFSDVRIKKVPITQDGKLIGTVGRSDVLRYLVKSA